MKFRLLFLIVLLGFVCSTWSQGRGWRYRNRKPIEKDTVMNVAYVDSLVKYREMLDSLKRINDSLGVKQDNDARFFRIFTPLTYYNTVTTNILRLDCGNDDDVNNAIDKSLMTMYVRHPEYVKTTESELVDSRSLQQNISSPIHHKVKFSEEETFVPDVPLDNSIEIDVRRPNFWTVSGEYYLQFLQNYISGNWYKGGESNYSMLASAVLQADYNNKQKVKFENKLELKLGFQTSRGDTLHSFTTSDDLIRYTGKFSLQATKNWYYTLQAIAYTQFMRGFKSNDPLVYSDIMSPFNLNLSLGMSYNVSAFHGKLTGSVNLSPLAMNLKYVGREALITRNGLDEGEHTLVDYGSGCTVELTWAFSDFIKWQTRLYGYTTYSRAEIEWENTFVLQFNKYISTNIFIYPRFDDSTSRDDHHGYWQFKEYVSLGFSYSF
ncbi:MAG: DUF3078 domain-containing protein [Prevotella sp.]|nr:DUF3078 domain-containing protein [Prevotella sp.]